MASHSRSLNNDYSAGQTPRQHSRHGTTGSRGSWQPAEDGELQKMQGMGSSVLSQGERERAVVSWASLPHKDQLLLLFLCRLVDFLQVASLQAYVFYQLKSMDDSASDARISQQAGLLQGCFTGAQVVTAMLWGKAADATWCGRKSVLVVGLAGTAFSCLGYGFATSFWAAAFWRAFGGGINGTVGIIRTMIAEITREKKYQSRAFLLLPMSFNVAGILGPVMGGILADPAKTLPGLFGADAVLGYKWIHDYPFALPSLINCALLTIVTALVFLFLRETSEERRGKFDYGLHLGNRIKQAVVGQAVVAYDPVPRRDVGPVELMQEKVAVKAAGRLPFRRIWTRNVLFTLVTSAFYDFHLGAFANIWALFLSTPRYTAHGSGHQRRHLPLLFTGGLGMPASTVGFATSILGILGMLLQVKLYPPIQQRLGTMRSFRYFLFLFPVAYFAAPYLSIVPSSTTPPQPAAGPFIWIGIILVLLLQVTARTFTLPASIILLNNCSPHPSVLGTIHGLGQSVSAGFRTVGPVIGARWYGFGLDIGVVAWGWWGVAALSAVGCVTAMGMHEGNGHEVVLDGEGDDESVSEGD
ncbi:hypothetical protein DCS_06429 [Drechmeria coniospora]|uniref:Major facilitator superfamily (MFS) profile domain-containing protein n=1 Tax=Drechmeria coniospora TaxID=98403 RepID=A0A151GBP8_DRECN|nr:hypothetical protein DCS_06429 [Drechmeria coniospora]KYK54471.1 hypothetical protein DCS_06429 [Drechmeria coniospora]